MTTNEFSRELRALVFAHPRSGSNTVAAILNQHPAINLMLEPFNEEREKWAEDSKNYLNETKTIADLDRVLAEIHETHNGFKHLSYQLPEDLTDYLLTQKDYRVLFLHRANILRSIVSAFIAEQTRVWTAEEKLLQGDPKKLEPLDIEKLRDQIDYLKEDTPRYLNVLKGSTTPYLEITYEQMFEGDDKKKNLETIFSFYGLDIPLDRKEDMLKLLLPTRKINSEGTYRLIPNIQEVEEMLGNEETGFIFK